MAKSKMWAVKVHKIRTETVWVKSTNVDRASAKAIKYIAQQELGEYDSFEVEEVKEWNATKQPFSNPE